MEGSTVCLGCEHIVVYKIVDFFGPFICHVVVLGTLKSFFQLDQVDIYSISQRLLHTAILVDKLF